MNDIGYVSKRFIYVTFDRTSSQRIGTSIGETPEDATDAHSRHANTGHLGGTQRFSLLLIGVELVNLNDDKPIV